MRLSCLPVSFYEPIIEGRMTVGEWAQMASEIGLDAIDLSVLLIPDQTPAGIEALRRQIEGAGMRLTMVTSYPDLTHPDPAQREREVSLEREVIAAAAGLGAELVRATAGQAHPETGLADGIAWAVEGLSRLVESARELGVTLVYENHAKPGVWDYTDFSQPPEVFLEIVRRTADVGLGVNFDTANATSFADDPVALLDQVIDRVVSVHAADTAAKGVQRAVLLGTGATPFVPLFRELKQAGWDGWICMEEVSFMGREGVERAARFVRRAWSEA